MAHTPRLPGRFSKFTTAIKKRWAATGDDTKELQSSLKGLMLLPSALTPLVAWVGTLAMINYAATANFNLGIEDISIPWIFTWGGVAIYRNSLLIIGLLIGLYTLYLIPCWIDPDKKEKILRILNRGVFGYACLFFILIIPSIVGLHFGESMAKQSMKNEGNVIHFAIQKTKEDLFHPDFIDANNRKNDLHLIHNTKDIYIVWSASKKRCFSISTKEIHGVAGAQAKP